MFAEFDVSRNPSWLYLAVYFPRFVNQVAVARVNHTRLDEERTDVAVVIAPEVRKGASIAGRAGDDEELGRPSGQVAKDRVLPMPNERPSAASQHCVTHLVDFRVVRKNRHRFWSFLK